MLITQHEHLSGYPRNVTITLLFSFPIFLLFLPILPPLPFFAKDSAKKTVSPGFASRQGDNSQLKISSGETGLWFFPTPCPHPSSLRILHQDMRTYTWNLHQFLQETFIPTCSTPPSHILPSFADSLGILWESSHVTHCVGCEGSQGDGVGFPVLSRLTFWERRD